MDPKIGPLSFREDQYLVTVNAFVDVGDYMGALSDESEHSSPERKQ